MLLQPHEGPSETGIARRWLTTTDREDWPSPGPTEPVPAWEEYEQLREAVYDYLDHSPENPQYEDIWRVLAAIMGEYQRDAFADVEQRIETTADEVKKLADETRESTDELAALIDEIDALEDSVQEISEATDDQAETTQDVVRMVDEVASISDQTEGEAETVAAGAQQQTSAIFEASSEVDRLAARASELADLLDEFDIEDESAEPSAYCGAKRPAVTQDD